MPYVPRESNNFSNNYFKAEVWSALLQKKWYNDSLISKVANTDWEGEIKKYGQIVHIRKRPDAVVNPYVIDQTVNWQQVTDEKITLTIDYAFYAAMKLDTVDIKQMDLDAMKEYVEEISKRQMNKEDEILFGSIFSSANVVSDYSTNVQSPLASSADYVLNGIANLRTKFNRKAVPKTGRFIVVSPEVEDIILRSDAARWDVSGDKNVAMREGEFGFKIMGFDLLTSNYVTGTGSASAPYNCVAGVKDAIAFARQVTETEVGIQLQDYFGKGVKSLNVFGFTASQPDGLGWWKVRTV